MDYILTEFDGLMVDWSIAFTATLWMVLVRLRLRYNDFLGDRRGRIVGNGLRKFSHISEDFVSYIAVLNRIDDPVRVHMSETSTKRTLTRGEIRMKEHLHHGAPWISFFTSHLDLFLVLYLLTSVGFFW